MVTQLSIPEEAEQRIATKRLVLVPITVADAEPLYELFSDGSLHTYVSYRTQPYPEHLERLKRWEKRISPEGDELWLNWTARRRKDEGVVGHFQIGLKADGVGTLGYLVARQHHGKGYATEALRSILKLLREKLGAVKATAVIDPRNLKSIQLAERLGLKLVGKLSETDALYALDFASPIARTPADNRRSPT